MRTRNFFAWVSLGALAIAAACAQGSNDTSGGPGAPGTIEAGAGFDAGDVTADGSDNTRLSTDSGSVPPGDDTGAPSGDDTGAPAGDDSGSPAEDAGIDSAPPPPVDAGHDSGSPVSVVPTTCSQTNQGVGCCVGNDNYYCNQLDAVHEVKCTGGQVCGWVASQKYYGCGTSTGSDPSGTYPIACQ